jgi:starvation-inducible outer membrane lipoprotein
MAMSSKALLIAAGALALAGCNTVNKNIGMEDAGLGETVKYNAAVQIINPEPVYTADSAQPGDSGVKGAAAVKRYRTDAVKQVEVMSSTESSGSGGSPR